jgi:uncharacterized membrane protein
LNGAAFLAQERPGDLAAVEWLRANAPGRPVVLEAVGGDYSEYGRISAFAGVPTVVGWIGHELQWRGPLPELDSRKDDVQRAYTLGDRAQVIDILRRYKVQFVVVGELERAAYGDDIASRLESWFPVAYEQSGTSVYRVVGSSAAGRAP